MNQQRRTVVAALAAAGLPISVLAQQKIVLGFSQIGAESEWRTANTESIKSSAKDAGIDLKFSDAQQKQENQIKAIRSFIAQKVDVIAFAPVVASGWGTVLREAKEAKIPVILSDRAVNEKDDSLWVTFMLSGYGLHAVGLELDAIAAVVIGGTLLSGGVGYVAGTLVGVLILGIVQTMISFDGSLSSWWTRIVIGALLLVFCLLQRAFERRRA